MTSSQNATQRNVAQNIKNQVGMKDVRIVNKTKTQKDKSMTLLDMAIKKARIEFLEGEIKEMKSELEITQNTVHNLEGSLLTRMIELNDLLNKIVHKGRLI